MSVIPGPLERFSQQVVRSSGKAAAFWLAAGMIVVWLALGPWYRFSDTWQLVINTTTTIVTFLMVFLIQRAQNKEAQAVQLKLNEIIVALHGASNRLINIEDLSEEEVHRLHDKYSLLAIRPPPGPNNSEGQRQRGSGAHAVREEIKSQPS